MSEEEQIPIDDLAAVDRNEGKRKWLCRCRLRSPVHWLKMLAREMDWTFVLGVIVVYGTSQGLGDVLSRVGAESYMKDVMRVEPYDAQVYAGVSSIPWIVKPLWGLLTDVLPIFGFRRRPYFILAGFLGVISMLLLALRDKLDIKSALLSLTAASAGVAIADVTMDACVAQNSISHPTLATDLQSLCAMSSSIGRLIGVLINGAFVYLIGSQGVFGLLTIPAGLVLITGIILNEPQAPPFPYKQVHKGFIDASKVMWRTLKCQEVWRPCLYMYISIALSFDIHGAFLYWYTDSKAGQGFSEEAAGYIFLLGSVGSLMGVVLYQIALKDHLFRGLIFWTQLLYGLSGMLDLILVLRLNFIFSIPDYAFAVIVQCLSRLISRLKWMPLFVLSARLCPSGIEGTFFALLMSVNNFAILSASVGGGLLLRALDINQINFDKLWLAVLLRNFLRLVPLALVFLVPGTDPASPILPTDDVSNKKENDNVELVSLINDIDSG